MFTLKRKTSITLALAAIVALQAVIVDTRRGGMLAADPTARDSGQESPEAQARRLADMRRIWAEMVAHGLDDSLSESRSRLLSHLDEWATDSSFTMTAARLVPGPQTTEKRAADTGFEQAGFHISGNGPLSACAKILHHIERANFPIRIAELQIRSKAGKEGQDDLDFELTVSTICRIPDAKRAADNPKVVPTEIDMIEYAMGWHASLRYLDCIHDLTDAFPADGQIFVTRFTLNDRMKCEFGGRSGLTDLKVRVLADQLRHNERFQEVSIQSIDRKPVEHGHGVKFTLTFTYLPMPHGRGIGEE